MIFESSKKSYTNNMCWKSGLRRKWFTVRILCSGLKPFKWRWGSWLIDDNLMRGKAWGKLYKKEGVRRRKVKRKEKQAGWKHFQSLRVLWLVRTYASAGTECGHIPHQVRPLNCHFQHEDGHEFCVPVADNLDSGGNRSEGGVVIL